MHDSLPPKLEEALTQFRTVREALTLEELFPGGYNGIRYLLRRGLVQRVRCLPGDGEVGNSFFGYVLTQLGREHRHDIEFRGRFHWPTGMDYERMVAEEAENYGKR